MKKSKIIIPALAALAFSTVASVTGTVAWFTSQSSVAITTDKFTITGLEGALSCEATAGIGTTVTGLNAETKISSKTYMDSESKEQSVSLTHGSFDIGSKVVTTANTFGTTPTPVYKNAVTNIDYDNAIPDTVEKSFMENEANYQYNAFTWQLKFTYGNGTAYTQPEPLNLYFNIDTAVSKANVTPTVGQPDTARSFRMAFFNREQSSTVNGFVWSPLQNKTMDINYADPASTKVGGASSYTKWTGDATGSGAETAYVADKIDGNLLYNASESDNVIKPITEGSAIQGRMDYLGQFNSTNNGVIKVDVVCWYEGWDVLNLKSGDDVKKTFVNVDMGFIVRNNKASA